MVSGIFRSSCISWIYLRQLKYLKFTLLNLLIFQKGIEHYINAEIINPTIHRGNGVTTLHPVFANAVGFYAIAKGAFG